MAFPAVPGIPADMTHIITSIVNKKLSGGGGAGEGGTRFGVHTLVGAGTPRAWAQGRAVEEPN